MNSEVGEEEVFQAWVGDPFNYEIYQEIADRIPSKKHPIAIFKITQEISYNLVAKVFQFTEQPIKTGAWIRGRISNYDTGSQRFMTYIVLKIAEYGIYNQPTQVTQPQPNKPRLLPGHKLETIQVFGQNVTNQINERSTKKMIS